VTRAPGPGSNWPTDRFWLRLLAGCGLAAVVAAVVVVAAIPPSAPAKPSNPEVQVPSTFVMHAGNSQWAVNGTDFCPPHGALPGARVFFNWSSETNQDVIEFNVLLFNTSHEPSTIYDVYNESHGGGSFPAECYTLYFGVNSSVE
jgi:hypothetical protein